jgi:hypothetical protein
MGEADWIGSIVNPERKEFVSFGSGRMGMEEDAGYRM